MDQRSPRDPGQARSEVFAELYGAHYRPLVALCRRRVGARDAEELAQEAFLRAWSSWDKYAPSRPFWPWVSTIANRLCIDRGRRRRTAELRGPYAIDDAGAVALSPEEALEASEEYRWAREALAQLRPDQQRVLRLREVEGWSYDRIADHEGVTVESVRGSLRRARTRLRLAYNEMSASSPVMVLLLALRSIRRRVSGWAYRTQEHAATAGVLVGRAGDAVAALMAIAIGTAGVTAPAGGTTAFAAAKELGRPPATTTSTTVDGAGATGTAMAGGLGGAAPPAGTRMADGRPQPELNVAGGPLTLPGRGADAPEDTSFQSFTVSPQYDRDHEIYASGYVYKDCAVSCPSIFRSRDGGASWTRIRSIGFEGGPIMLPPNYPVDNRIFVGGPHALKVSADGGHMFRHLTPAGGFTAMSPAFSSGDPRILVGAIPGWIYHDDNKAVTPFDKVPQSTSVALSFAYAPDYPRDHRIVVGGTDTSPDANSTVSACDVSACTPPAALAGSTDTPAVKTSRSFSQTGLAFAWSGERFYRSTDGAASFARVALPLPGAVQSVAEGTDGMLYVAVFDNNAGGTAGGLLASRDAGRTWARLGAGTVLDGGVLSVAVLPDGRLLAGPYAAGRGGVQCSSDGGRTWAPRCS